VKDSLGFYAFDLLREVPEVCSLCRCAAPVFRYQSHRSNPDGETQEVAGFCCAACAARLLRKLESTENREWQREREAMDAEGVTVSDLQVVPEGKAADK